MKYLVVFILILLLLFFPSCSDSNNDSISYFRPDTSHANFRPPRDEYLNSREDINVLIRREEHCIESVWKSGDDFRVLIRDVENSTMQHPRNDWFRFENGVVGEKTYEPPGVTMQNPWADIPATRLVSAGRNRERLSGFSFTETPNNYPWQVQWDSYFVRAMRCIDTNTFGLWLAKQGEEPILISEGHFSQPVVIPGTDWVVCSKVESWEHYPISIVVKINLNTFEKTTIDLPPSHRINPVAFINDRLLILRGSDGYLFDILTNTVEKVVDGDLSPFFLGGLGGRFFQQSSEPNKYFALSNQVTIGVYDISTFTFSPLVDTGSAWILNHEKMWVDEISNVVYLVIDDNLVEMPF